jgi:hypothetical protein
MTADVQPTATAQALHTCEWTQWPMKFTLHTDNADVANRAETVLRHWRINSYDGTSNASLTMRVISSDNGYTLHVDNDAEPVTYKDVSALLRAIEMHAALALLDLQDQVLTVHAGLLARDNHGVLVVGPSQSGKSTLSCALWRAGWQLLADDVAIVDCEKQHATPLLRRVSLRDPSRELLGEEFWDRIIAAPSCDRSPEGYVFHPDDLTDQTRARSTPLSLIVFLSRNGVAPGKPATAHRIEPSRALLSLAPYTNVLPRTDLGATMRRLGPLLNTVPAFDLVRGPLPRMIATIEKLAGV